MPLLAIVPPMPGAERRFKPFVEFVHTCGWETEFVRLESTGRRPPFGSTEIFHQVDAQTAGKVVLGYSLGALYAHLGALRARHLILGSISPFFLEDDDEPERWMVSYKAVTPPPPPTSSSAPSKTSRCTAAPPPSMISTAPGIGHSLRTKDCPDLRTPISELRSRPLSQTLRKPSTNSGTRTTCRPSRLP